MCAKFLNKYRIESARASWWNYASEGAYFITIITKNRKHYFGRIVDGKMELSEKGKIVQEEWIKTPAIRPDMNLMLGAFVVMPDHFHAILVIRKNEHNRMLPTIREPRAAMASNEISMHASDEVQMAATYIQEHNSQKLLSEKEIEAIKKFHRQTSGLAPQSKNLSSVVRGFKSAVTTRIKKSGDPDFGWHPRYHDSIIRNADAFERIWLYIQQNPQNWKSRDASRL